MMRPSDETETKMLDVMGPHGLTGEGENLCRHLWGLPEKSWTPEEILAREG